MEGAAFACGDTLTDRPLTIVTVSGAPDPENSATFGYPSTVHEDPLVFVTFTTPVIVPAAPVDCPADAEMWLHAVEAAVVGVVVVEIEDVDVVLDEVVVAAW